MSTLYLFRYFMLALSLAVFPPILFAQEQTADLLPVAAALTENVSQSNFQNDFWSNSANGDSPQAAWGFQASPLAAAASDGMPEAPLPQNQQNSQTPPQQNTQASAPQNSQPPAQSERERAEQQLKQEEKQRILAVAPNFNTSYIADAAPLSRSQKFNLAFHSAVDPFIFFAAAADAGLGQAEDSFPVYGQGAEGFAKYFGASYADDFDGTMIGNALFPALLKQDPRYFRKGTGTFKHRLFYSIATTVWCKNDNGKWGPNYSNVLGNLAAGGISNLYYPAADRGASLTIERGFTVTAEGTIGAVFDEFWPDIAHKVLRNHLKSLQPNIPPPSTTN